MYQFGPSPPVAQAPGMSLQRLPSQITPPQVDLPHNIHAPVVRDAREPRSASASPAQPPRGSVEERRPAKLGSQPEPSSETSEDEQFTGQEAPGEAAENEKVVDEG
jgi:hypothetical protein